MKTHHNYSLRVKQAEIINKGYCVMTAPKSVLNFNTIYIAPG